jgi:hypothetical protein
MAHLLQQGNPASRLLLRRIVAALPECRVRIHDCMGSVGPFQGQRERTSLPDHNAGAPGIFKVGAAMAAMAEPDRIASAALNS